MTVRMSEAERKPCIIAAKALGWGHAVFDLRIWRYAVIGVFLFALALATYAALALRFSQSLAGVVTNSIASILNARTADALSPLEACGAWSEARLTDGTNKFAPNCELRDLVQADAQAGPTRAVSKPTAPKQPLAKPKNDPVEALINKSVEPYIVLINVPPQVAGGTPFEVDVVVQTAPDQNLVQIADVSRRDLARQDIEVTPDVQVLLQGGGFEIEGEENAWRRLTRRSPSIWKWNVTATGEGEKTLTIIVRGKVRLKDDDERWFDAFITTRKVTVVLAPMARALAAAESAQKIADMLQSLWLVLSGAFAAFGTFALRQLRRMKRRPTEEPAGV